MNTISMTKDKKQENFCREYKTWKEFNDSRDFNWIENEFSVDQKHKGLRSFRKYCSNQSFARNSFRNSHRKF